MNINPHDLSASVLNAITVESTTPQLVNLVFMGRGRQCYDQPGNVAFRRIIEVHVLDYVNSISPASKTLIVNLCHGQVVANNLVTVERVNDQSLWTLASFEVVRNKVAHSLRDAVANHRAAPNQEMNHDEVLLPVDPVDFPFLPGVFLDNRDNSPILDLNPEMNDEVLLDPDEDDEEVLLDPANFPFLPGVFLDNRDNSILDLNPEMNDEVLDADEDFFPSLLFLDDWDNAILDLCRELLL